MPPTTHLPTADSLWDQAVSTRGGRWAVGVAVAAICLLIAGCGIALAGSARADRAAAGAAAEPRTSTDLGSSQGTTQGTTQGTNGNGKAKDRGEAAGDLNALPGKLGNVTHGEITRPTAAGTETLLVQNGTVAASSDTSITVKSVDGFAETYAVSPTTTVRGPAKAAGLAVGTAVSVVAAKDGKAALLLATRGKPS